MELRVRHDIDRDVAWTGPLDLTFHRSACQVAQYFQGDSEQVVIANERGKEKQEKKRVATDKWVAVRAIRKRRRVS